MANNKRVCPYCKIAFNIDKEDYIKVKTRYAHKTCYEKHQQEAQSLRELTDYIKKLYAPYEPDWGLIGMQIKKYKDEGMTYYGMRYTLEYYYIVRKNKIDKQFDYDPNNNTILFYSNGQPIGDAIKLDDEITWTNWD